MEKVYLFSTEGSKNPRADSHRPRFGYMPIFELMTMILMCPLLQTGGVGVNTMDTENRGEVLLKGKSSLHYHKTERGPEFIRKKHQMSSKIREGKTKDGI